MRSHSILVVAMVLLAVANIASAIVIRDIEIDFVTIGNAGNPGDTRAEANPYGCGAVNYNYRIGKYEVTNAQWNAFTSAAGAPTGNPSTAYDASPYWTGTNVPTNQVSWYEAAQFCNYLTSGDKSKGAYLFSGNNTDPADFLGIDRDWAISAYGIVYVIPTENEWYKAAYYTGSGYSTYANGTDIAPVSGVETNYGQSSPFDGPWDVGTGAMEQNGMFDMMGNVYEWNETIIRFHLYIRGGGYHNSVERLESSQRYYYHPESDNDGVGFRVASVPEPGAGDLLVCMPIYDGVSLYNGITGEYLRDFISPGYGGLNHPTGITFGPDGNLYVGNEETDSILRYDGKTGQFIDEFVPSGSGNLSIPRTILFGPEGNLYVADEGIDAVLKYDGQTGDFIGNYTTGYTLDSPFGMAFGPDNNLYVTTIQTDQVVRFNGTTGVFIDEFIDNVYVSHPAGLAFGPDGNLYLADSEQNEITRYNGQTGVFIDKFVASGSGGLTIQEGNILFGPDGNLYVASDWTRILRYDGQSGAFIDEFVSAGSTWVGFFAFVPEPIQLLLPNGGETLTSGKACPIKWSSIGSVSDVLIEYSVDNGSSWTTVSPPNVGNNGLYNWLVPAADSNQCRVRVSVVSHPYIRDTSDDVFAIETSEAGYIVAWGYNAQRQCEAPIGNDFIEVAGGGYFSLSLKSDGSLAGWGQNSSGQLDVPAGNNFVDISAGIGHGFALKSDGSLTAWGRNVDGQNNVPTDAFYTSISSGGHHNLAIKYDGSVVACGQNDYGQCDVPEVNDFIRISGGYLHSLGLKADGSIVAWGSNDEGQCDVPTGHDFSAIAGGGQHSVALKSDGSLAAWGLNDYGQCDVPEGNDFFAIAAGARNSLALKSDGSLVSWGSNTDNFGNYFGQCDIPSGNHFIEIAAGEWHGLALVSIPLITGYIDWTDLIAFCERWLYGNCSEANDWCGRADINRNTVVDSTDYSWLAKYLSTIPPEPNSAGNPEPHDTATSVSVTADLSWTAGSNAAAHGVYFGTNPTPDAIVFKGYQTDTTFDPVTMVSNTTYYWQVDEVGLGGKTIGDVWCFTTMVDPNLIGRWRFDEEWGVIAYDSSSKENHGMLMDGLGNGLVWAPAEGSLDFDGSNNLSRVVVSTVGMSTTAGTITIWARLAEPQNRGDGRNGIGCFFGCDNGVKDRILLYMDNNNTQLDVRVGDHSETNIITLGTLFWYHIALTWNSGSYVVYLNGSEIAAGTYGGLTSLPSTADIGNNGGSYKQSFHGLMGNVQVYDKNLSTAEIQQLYQDVAN